MAKFYLGKSWVQCLVYLTYDTSFEHIVFMGVMNQSIKPKSSYAKLVLYSNIWTTKVDAH